MLVSATCFVLESSERAQEEACPEESPEFPNGVLKIRQLLSGLIWGDAGISQQARTGNCSNTSTAKTPNRSTASIGSGKLVISVGVLNFLLSGFLHILELKISHCCCGLELHKIHGCVGFDSFSCFSSVYRHKRFAVMVLTLKQQLWVWNKVGWFFLLHAVTFDVAVTLLEP